MPFYTQFFHVFFSCSLLVVCHKFQQWIFKGSKGHSSAELILFFINELL